MTSGLWRATVTRLDSDGFVYLTVPRLGPTEYGPLEPLPGVALAAQDRVLVGLIENNPNDLAIIRPLG